MPRRLLLALLVLLLPVVAGAQSVDVAARLAAVRAELTGLTLPAPERFTSGDRTVAAGDVVPGPVAAQGDLRIDGTVEGDVIALDGDVTVGPAGRITGTAVAIGGEVRTEPGAVVGERRRITGALMPTPPPSAASLLGDRLSLTLGWATIVLLIGLGLLFFGGRTLDTIGRTLDTSFSRSFLVGLLALLGAVPALILACVALALTLLGILLIPFVVVAAVLAYAGLVVLAFLASARLLGHALLRSPLGTDRSAAVRALAAGVLAFTGVWVLNALVASMPVAGSLVRILAIGSTGAAIAAGLGATLLSRGGSRPLRSTAPTRPTGGAPRPEPSPLGDLPAWQTPTPVSGVAAVKRPVANAGGTT
jgi:hypothetical protein